MPRFSLLRTSKCLAVTVFIFFVWLYSIQIKKTQSDLSGRILNIHDQLRELKLQSINAYNDVNSYPDLASSSDFTTLDKVLPRDFYNRPNMHAAILKGGCVVVTRYGLRSKAELQTVEMYNNISFENVNGGVWKQGFELKYNSDSFTADNPLNVIVIPHSHNDPGWKKTFEQYFQDQTSNILDNVVKKLQENSQRRFIWAEISYLSLWWERSNEDMRSRMLAVLKSGQLEIVTGGWVMEDEANTHIYAMIDQLIEGNHWIKDTLHESIIPKSAYSIDPFGHSSTVAYLRKRMGFHNMLIHRTHYEVKKFLASSRNLEFTWHQTWDTSEQSQNDIFCHMMPFFGYDIPHTCGPDPKVCCQFDFAALRPSKHSCPWGVPPQKITDKNVAARSKLLVDQYKKKAMLFKSNVLLVLLGADFRYEDEKECDRQFKNYEKLFAHINSNKKLNTVAKWGTLSDYFELAHQKLNPSDIPQLSGDFFTYADRDNHYWSGYFTSRPFYKKLDRVLESRLRSAEVIFSIANVLVEPPQTELTENWKEVARNLFQKLTVARRNLGLFQHHDGITGTAQDHVVVDYGFKLLTALDNANQVIASSSHYLLSVFKQSPSIRAAPLTNTFNGLFLDETRASHDSLPQYTVISIKSLQPGKKTPVVFYNSLAFSRQQIVSVLVDSPHVAVKCPMGNIIPSQVSARFTAHNSQSNSIEMESDVFELWFQIKLSPLSLSTYFILPVTPSEAAVDQSQSKPIAATKSVLYAMRSSINDNLILQMDKMKVVNTDPRTFELSNYHYILHFGNNGLLKSITDRKLNKNTEIGLDFATYGTANGKDMSGAYLFMPDGHPKSLPSLSPTVLIEKGPLMSRVIVKLDNVIHTVRLLNSPGIDGQAVMISNLVDIRMLSNRELTMRFNATNLMKNGKDGAIEKVFYTDLNAFQMQARHYHRKLPIEANFYPMPSQMVVNEAGSNDGVSRRLTLHSAQSLGAGITSTGHVDVILDRRLMQDDKLGLAQGVKDNKLTPNDFWLVLESFGVNEKMREEDASNYTIYPTLFNQQANLALNNPILTLLPSDNEMTEVLSTPAPDSPGFNSQPSLEHFLPCDVNLLNFRTMKLESKMQALIILHRQGHSCKMSSFGSFSPTNCALTNGYVDLTSVFFPTSNTRSLKFTEYTLNGITVLNNGQPQSTVHVEPSEINTYLVEFG